MGKDEIGSVIELASDHALLNRGIEELLLAITRREMNPHLLTGNSTLDLCFYKLNELLEDCNALKEEIKKIKNIPIPKPCASASSVTKDAGRSIEPMNCKDIFDNSGNLLGKIFKV